MESEISIVTKGVYKNTRVAGHPRKDREKRKSYRTLYSVYPLWAVDIPLQDPHLVTDSGLRGASRRGRKDRGGDGGDRRFRLQSRAASAGARVEAVTRFRVFCENTASTVETT